MRLAIGYISFLAELVASDRHPADVLQNTVPEPPKKIFVNSVRGKFGGQFRHLTMQCYSNKSARGTK